jgi:outer membrane receptor protein involved in Fe transport
LKRKLLVFTLAAIPAALLPLAAFGQVSSSSTTATAEKTEPEYRYEASAGYGYTSLNQLNQSRSGLQGVELSITREFTRHFGVLADGAYYKYAIKSGNPGSPAVDAVLFGPVVHAELYGHVSGFVRAFLGGEHTAGNGTIPNVSFAGGFGGGLEYSLSPRWSLRASGDDILSSFVQDPDHLGYSPHRRGNGRAALSAVFHFGAH